MTQGDGATERDVPCRIRVLDAELRDVGLPHVSSTISWRLDDHGWTVEILEPVTFSLDGREASFVGVYGADDEPLFVLPLAGRPIRSGVLQLP